MSTIVRMLLTVALLAAALPGIAADYPSKPIRLVVPFAAGGTSDHFGRLVGKVIAERLGVPVIVDNRVGAGGNIGSDAVAKADPDGYTLLLGGAGHLVVGPALYTNFPFDPARDLVPVTLVATAMNMLTLHPSVPARNLAEFVEYAKAHPGKLNYASGGTGGLIHLAAEMLSADAGIKMNHIPYKGSALAHTDLLSGRVQVMFDNLPNVLPYVRSGQLRALAVTGRQRSPLAPDVPTIAEQGYPDYEVVVWWGVLAPRGTPPAIVDKLNREIHAGLGELREQIAGYGGQLAASTPDEFAQLIRTELRRWAKVVKRSGAKAD